MHLSMPAEGPESASIILIRRDRAVRNILKRLWQEEEGQDLVEYGLLLVLISLAATAAMSSLASAISTAFGNASTSLSS
jgi:pilus assembly protein Flp/PilA